MRAVEKDAQKRFIEDTREHKMTVALDQGLNRNLQFKKPGCSAYHFNITTWPGYLCISGDMGCFVFSREADMLHFFKTKRMDINPHYWAQKVVSSDPQSGVKEFSEKKFQENLQRDFFTTKFASKDKKSRVWQEVKEQVLSQLEYSQTIAIKAAMDFYYVDDRPEGLSWEQRILAESPKRHYIFQDFYEHDFQEYTYRFLWACHAIIYAIQQYDAHKEAKKPRHYWPSVAA